MAANPYQAPRPIVDALGQAWHGPQGFATRNLTAVLAVSVCYVLSVLLGGLPWFPTIWHLLATLAAASLLASVWANLGRGFDQTRRPRYRALRLASVLPTALLYSGTAIVIGGLLF